MKFTNVLSLGVVFATAFTVTTAAPISTSIAAREARYAALARRSLELDARDPFNWGGLIQAALPIAKPWLQKIPVFGKLFGRDGSIDAELLEDYIVAQVLADQNKVATRSLELEDLVARDPFNWGGLIKAALPIARPWLQKIPGIGKLFRRDGTIDEDLLNDFIVAEALSSRSNAVAARSVEDLVARDPFNWGGLIKAALPIARPWLKKIPGIGSLFRRDGSLDEELLNDFLVAQAIASQKRVAARSNDDLNDDDVAGLLAELVTDLSRRDPRDVASAWNDFVTAIVDAE